MNIKLVFLLKFSRGKQRCRKMQGAYGLPH
jgi:hypothetical protein